MILGRRGRLFGDTRKSAFVRDQEGGFTGLLDDYPGADKAYSVCRRLTADYTGALIEIRVDTTGQPTYDIGYDADGNLDVADLVSKAAGNDVYVSKRYNQGTAGSSLDNIQISAANQPRIATAGVVTLLNGKPTLDFDTAGQYLETPPSPITTGANDGFFIVAVGATRDNSTTQFFENADILTTRLSQIFKVNAGDLDTINFEEPTVIRIIFGSPFPNNTQSILISKYNGTTTAELIRNGVSQGTVAQNNQRATAGVLISGGGIYKTSDTLNGFLQESIFWQTEQESNSAAIQAAINDYYGAY